MAMAGSNHLTDNLIITGYPTLDIRFLFLFMAPTLQFSTLAPKHNNQKELQSKPSNGYIKSNMIRITRLENSSIIKLDGCRRYLIEGGGKAWGPKSAELHCEFIVWYHKDTTTSGFGNAVLGAWPELFQAGEFDYRILPEGLKLLKQADVQFEKTTI